MIYICELIMAGMGKEKNIFGIKSRQEVETG